jgi:hypothetical protein
VPGILSNPGNEPDTSPGDWVVIPGQGALLTIDWSTPSSPEIVNTLTDPTDHRIDSAENLLLVGNTLYVTNAFSTGTAPYQYGYAAVDVTNLMNLTSPAPSILAALDDSQLAGARYSVSHGNYNYVTTFNGYLAVVERSAFALSASLSLSSGELTGIDVKDYTSTYGIVVALVMDTANSALYAVDVTTPASPALITTLTDTTNFPHPSNIHVVGPVAYTTAYAGYPGDEPSGITVVDISNPYIPFVINKVDASSGVIYDHLYIMGSRGYASDTSSTGGLYIYQLGGCA